MEENLPIPTLRFRKQETISKPKIFGRTHQTTRVISHLFTGSLAGIGKLPALAGWYIRYGMYGIFVL
jgi:hypothetical protein